MHLVKTSRHLTNTLVLIKAILVPIFFFSFTPGEVESEAAYLVNAKTGVVLYAKNEKKKLYPASLTKIATALYLIEKKGEALGGDVLITRDMVATQRSGEKERLGYLSPAWRLEEGGTHVGLAAGEKLRVKDLLACMMVASGNDAANALSFFVSGSLSKFSTEFNTFLYSIGCRETQFKNAHGLHHPEHYTTAEELGLIAMRAMKHPMFREVVKKNSFNRPATDKSKGWPLRQTNKLLRSQSPFFYPRAIGMKTGYTSQAQYCLAAAAEKEGRELIAILLYGKEKDARFRDARRLFDAAFKEKKMKAKVVKQDSVFTFSDMRAAASIEASPSKSLEITFFPSEKPDIAASIAWETMEFPVEKGSKVGKLLLIDKRSTWKEEMDLFARETVEESWSHFFLRILGRGD